MDSPSHRLQTTTSQLHGRASWSNSRIPIVLFRSHRVCGALHHISSLNLSPGCSLGVWLWVSSFWWSVTSCQLALLDFDFASDLFDPWLRVRIIRILILPPFTYTPFITTFSTYQSTQFPILSLLFWTCYWVHSPSSAVTNRLYINEVWGQKIYSVCLERLPKCLKCPDQPHSDWSGPSGWSAL
jgi:hypothetical protein